MDQAAITNAVPFPPLWGLQKLVGTMVLPYVVAAVLAPKLYTFPLILLAQLVGIYLYVDHTAHASNATGMEGVGLFILSPIAVVGLLVSLFIPRSRYVQHRLASRSKRSSASDR